MGTDKLKRLADEASDDLAGSVAALVAELRSAVWSCADDLLQAFPSARSEGPTMVIDVDPTHRVAMLVNYTAGCVLVVEAGRHGAAVQAKERSRR